MKRSSENNFVHLIDKNTGNETYLIQFDFGTRFIEVKPNHKITLEYVHGSLEQVFNRYNNDLIIGDDMYLMIMDPLGVGHGKELWTISENNDSTYSISVKKYCWMGSSYGYSDEPKTVETKIMTQSEFEEFQTSNKVVLNVGENTLYTTWPVLPDPTIHYHMNDMAFYAPANGKIILKDYFINGTDNVYIGEKLLSDIICENSRYGDLSKVPYVKSYDIDILPPFIYGGDKPNKIKSLIGDDEIIAGRGDDKITLGAGNKTLYISQGDGKDTVYNFHKAKSVEFSIDTDDVFFTKSGKNLVINRKYDDDTEKTVINNYFKNWEKDNKIIISQDNTRLVDDLTQAFISGEKHLKLTSTSSVKKGTNLSDEAYSSNRDETFILKKGNDIIHFDFDGDVHTYPYSFGNDVVKLTKGSHVTLDFNNMSGNFTYERKGNDAIITSRHQIAICGRSNGKEEWNVKKEADGTYSIKKTGYYFTGSGYSASGDVTEITMTKEEFNDFQTQNNVQLKVGSNILYTSWAVVPNPIIHYSMKDGANWGITLGTVRLKDYFKYNEDSVYIGEKSLMDFFKADDKIYEIDKTRAKTRKVINDSFMNETIKGSRYKDKIISNYGEDTIIAGKGNDNIYLGSGTKTVNINKGDGKDTLIIASDDTSVNIVFDEVDGLDYGRKGNNFVIVRDYGNKKEKTVIKDYFLNNLDNNIVVSTPDYIQTLSEDLVNMSWQIICRYPPVEEPLGPLKPEEVDAYNEPNGIGVWTCYYPPGDEIRPTLICAYPAFDDVVTVAEIQQDVSAWQSDNGINYDTNACYSSSEQVVLVISE